MTNKSVMPLTKINSDELTERVLVVGDPARAAKAAELLEESCVLAKSREYHSYRGYWKDTEITVVSHGIGASGAACCFEELCRAGAKVIIRSGTAGGLQPDIDSGDVVVALASVREDGLTASLVPDRYPAIADIDTVIKIREALKNLNKDYSEGVVLTQSSFYPFKFFDNVQPLWRDAGVVAVEMEIAALFIVCSLNNVKAGALVAIDGNPLLQKDENMANYDPYTNSVGDAVKICLRASLDALAASEI